NAPGIRSYDGLLPLKRHPSIQGKERMKKPLMFAVAITVIAAAINSCTYRPQEVRHEAEAPPATAHLIELRYSRFTIWYDCERGEPRRFAYRLDRDIGTLARQDDFRPDRSLPTGCKGQHSDKSYNQVPRFHRGHLVPVNHLDEDPVAMSESNLMTNIVTQLAEHNSHTWGRTEQLIDCMRDIRPVEVIGGVVYGDSPENQANDFFVDSHGIRTPEAFWKVLITTDPATEQPRIISWWIPHQNGFGARLDGHVRTVRQLAQLFGPAVL